MVQLSLEGPNGMTLGQGGCGAMKIEAEALVEFRRNSRQFRRKCG
jgi:hypothetical protein